MARRRGTAKAVPFPFVLTLSIGPVTHTSKAAKGGAAAGKGASPLGTHPQQLVFQPELQALAINETQHAKTETASKTR